ncbi:hypothetical protein ACGF0D_28795 [Kitasatospora sp. NPDC048298]|uniref:hypothetical protein n=1 Tax=Kitasatospora sp. NPDC048298 TaxID=3364049 RepID=UPI0037134245
MLLLGLLLMAASGAFVGLLIADNLSGGPDYQVTILGSNLVVLNSLSVFLAGVALALLFCLGLAMIRLSGRVRRSSRAARATQPERTDLSAHSDLTDLTGRTDLTEAEQRAATQGGRMRHRPGH